MHVGGIWDRERSTIVHQVYVEKLEPLNSSERFSIPIILVHGDYHDGTLWHQKPDGGRGWAEWFARAGFTVFLPDLPFHGRSKIDHIELMDRIQYMDASVIENELTAPEKSVVHNAYFYEIAKKHSQWPGNGKRGDPIFDNYIQRLYPEHYDRRVRQVASQYAIFDLLRQTGPAVLIGQGMGGNIALLGLDAKPELVRAVIAVEPAGPPFSSATKLDQFGNRIHLKEPEYIRGLRAYGISDVPVNYDPPANISLKTEGGGNFEVEAEEELPPIPVAKFFNPERNMSCYLQNPDLVLAAESFTTEDGHVEHQELKNPIRTLTNISQKPVAVVTTEASPHALYDWATVAFLKQAGVRVTHLELNKQGIHGNGHLCFLEKNSDEIAHLLFRWI
ncbi:alpha/beta-hydrolase, partial [Thozetella sp. PMI_491]